MTLRTGTLFCVLLVAAACGSKSYEVRTGPQAEHPVTSTTQSSASVAAPAAPIPETASTQAIIDQLRAQANATGKPASYSDGTYTWTVSPAPKS